MGRIGRVTLFLVLDKMVLVCLYFCGVDHCNTCPSQYTPSHHSGPQSEEDLISYAERQLVRAAFDKYLTVVFISTVRASPPFPLLSYLALYVFTIS